MDDDLDALLDSALDTMTEQDHALEREKLQQEAAAQTLLNEAMSGAGGGGLAGMMGGEGSMPGMDAEMIKALGGLMSILQKGPDAMENASDEEMAAITAQLQSTLDQLKLHPDLSSDDANQLGGMKKMMEQLNSLEKGQSEGPNGEPALSEEEFSARKEELTKMLESMSAPGGLMGGAGGGGPDLPAFPFGQFGSAAAGAAAAANAAGVPLPPLPEALLGGAANGLHPASNGAPMSEEEACRQVFELTLGILQEKEIEQPFLKLREAYGPWLEANRASLTPEDLARFENQFRVATEMCGFFEKEKVSDVLKDGGASSTEQRAAVLERFGTLMAELHSFGEVPPSLFPEAAEPETSE